MKYRMIFDLRWLNSGGIGRFCDQVSCSISVSRMEKIDGGISDILSIRDIFRLSKMMFNKGYFFSPGYNGPMLGTNRAIITVHDLMHLKFPSYLNLKNKIYYWLIVRRIVRNSPLVFTVSNFTREEICKWAKVDKDKIVVLYNGLDRQFYHEDVEPIVRAKPYFFYVGNNKPHKNLVRLIRSFYLSGLQDRCDLLLSCSITKEIEDIVAELDIQDSVIFLNGIEEEMLPRYYKGAIATTMVTLYEGFGLPIIESMAVGTPVITSNVTSMPEIAGDAAFLADPYSVDSIANGMKMVFEDADLRSDLSAKGLERAKDFSWDKTRQLFDEAVNKVIGSY